MSPPSTMPDAPAARAKDPAPRPSAPHRPASPKPAANKNWLLVQFRKWHSWGGLFLSLFILVVAATGILLNHKDFFFHGGEKKPTGALTPSTDLASLEIGFDEALAIAREHYGDVPLEKIELKDEQGRLLYKVARGGGEEIRIDARTGAAATKYGMALGEHRAAGGWNWAKIVDDLHTGKLFGTAGMLVIDLTAGVMIALTLTGVYLWAIPQWRKRESRQRRAANPLPAATARPELAPLGANTEP